MASRLALPLALTAALLAACKTQVQPTGLKGVTPIEGDQVTVTERHEGTAAEASYDWNYPNYPENYNVEPLRRDYASGRSLAELGSLAGPWLEGAEAKELPVGQPNVRRGAAVVRQLGGAVTAELQPKLSETPFQAFLRIREGLSSARLNNVPLSRDQLWDITFHLYTRAQPDFGVPVPVKMDPDSANDASKRKTGGQIFGSNCAMCHGADGWGRGHSGYALQPPPANFHEPRRLYNRSDEQLYTVLRDGIYGTAMPPWRDKLSEAEIRSVVAFIRSYSYSVEDETAQGGGSPAPQVRGAN
ncbi:MAG TPA: cytochrome c, partial [Deinococcales bacterium]|nr:cytochrome c [Deinococcales bacterium]